MAARKKPFRGIASVLGKLLGFLTVSVVCGVLVSGLLIPTVTVTSTTAANSFNAFDAIPDDLKIDAAPAQTSKIVAADGSLIANIYFQNRTPVHIDQVSPVMQKAIVAIEDARFYSHGGVDPTGIIRALAASVAGQRQGASTITQQYVNNIIFQSLEAAGRSSEVRIGASKGFEDKIREIRLAIGLEKKFSKDQILQGYLNIVNFANGAYGIQAASQYYFKKDAKDLTLPEGALLAGIVNSPNYYNPVLHPEHAQERRNEVLQKMEEQGMISQEEHHAAAQTPIQVSQNKVPKGCTAAPMAPFFCDYVRNIFLNNPDYGETVEDRDRLLTQGGLTIKTTLQSGPQKKAQEQVDSTMTPNDLKRLNRGSSLVSVEPGTGKIVAMAQNFTMSSVDAPGQTSYNFNIPKVDEQGKPIGGLGTMQVGSTVKPFTFGAWLDAGKSMYSVVNGSKRDYPASFKWNNSCGKTASNFVGENLLQNDSGKDYTSMSVLQGLVRSINTITFATAAQLDICKITKILESTGIRDGRSGEKLTMSQASALLGSDTIAPLNMANSFATFASGGMYCTPNAIDSITDASGRKYPVPSANCHRTVSADVANGVMFGLQKVLSEPQGSGALIRPAVNHKNYNIGAKTGTTNNNVDTWVVGATSGLAAASWFGNPTGRIEDPKYFNQNVVIKGHLYKALDGANIAGTAFSNYMNAVASQFKTAPFPAPPNTMISGAPHKSTPSSTGSPSPSQHSTPDTTRGSHSDADVFYDDYSPPSDTGGNAESNDDGGTTSHQHAQENPAQNGNNNRSNQNQNTRFQDNRARNRNAPVRR